MEKQQSSIINSKLTTHWKGFTVIFLKSANYVKVLDGQS